VTTQSPADSETTASAEYPQPIAELSRHRSIAVHRRTLQRALDNDPTAPDPQRTDDQGRRYYLPSLVVDWWPRRRRPGRPRPAAPADTGTASARTADQPCVQQAGAQ
jgi:hypothetical protein